MKEQLIQLARDVFRKYSPVPRLIIYSLDMFIVFASLIFAYFLRFNFSIPFEEEPLFGFSVLLVLLIRGGTYLALTIHKGIIRFTSLQDIERITLAIAVSTLIIFISSFIFRVITEKAIIPYSVMIIDFFLVSTLSVSYRLMIKSVYLSLIAPVKEKTSCAVFGSKTFCSKVISMVDKEPGADLKVDALLTLNKEIIDSRIEGIRFYHLDKLEGLIKKKGLGSVIFSDRKTSLEQKNQITDICLKEGIKPVILPEIQELIHGGLTFSQFREVKVEDILDRKPVQFPKDPLMEEYQGKTILITGAAGSIGSEITRQLTEYKPKLLIVLDHAETPLFDLVQNLVRDKKFYSYEKVIGSISDPSLMGKVFDKFTPDIVFHAAAYKHVPMMEKHPNEAVRVNVLGTKILADHSVRAGVNKFIMISTDKAVNPTNVMGASKRIAELYCRLMNAGTAASFIMTRFGNVLGSNGSVIPTFREQIRRGGPVTVTHTEMTRYFMSISEACQLVLQAGSMGGENEIFIFDMGQPVKIYDMARKMISLSGFKPDEEIKIVISGLRPGEKLKEELLTGTEEVKETYHPRIKIAEGRAFNAEKTLERIQKLVSEYQQMDEQEIVRHMKQIVPEYLSQNSPFEILDKELAQSQG